MMKPEIQLIISAARLHWSKCILTLFHMGQKMFGEHGGGEGGFCPPPVTFQFVNLLRS